MKKLALLVYPEFSLQEVMDLSRLFRWRYDVYTEVISTGNAPVKSEEGILVQPEKTTDQVDMDDYLCLVLPGCSDHTELCRDPKLIPFLSSLKGSGLPVGAICSGPLLLAKAGLLEGRRFTASLFAEHFDICPFLDRDKFVKAPLVVDGNIATAGGDNFNGFAVAMARLCGFDCPERILSGYMDDWTEEDYEVHLPPEAVEELRGLYAPWH